MDGSLSADWFSPTSTLAPRCRKGGHPPHHSITSSARASKVGGTSRPSGLAGLKLMATLGACTGGAGRGAVGAGGFGGLEMDGARGSLHGGVGRVPAPDDAIDIRS